MFGNDGDISLNLRLEDREFEVTVKNSGKLLAQLRQELTKTAQAASTNSRHFNSFTSGFKNFMMTVAATRFALLDIDQVFLSLPKSILKTSGEIQRLTKLMEGLSRQSDAAARAQEAASNTDYIIKTAKEAPFQVKAIADSFVKLKTAGIDPTNGSLKGLLDSVAKFGGDSETLHRASVAIQQMAGKGVISMEELRQQLGEAIPNAMQMMARGIGMSMEELTKHVSKGEVIAGDALRRMLAVMQFTNAGAAAAMMDTWKGLTSRISTEWDLLQNEVGKSGFAQEVNNQLRDLISLMSSNDAKGFARELGQGLAQGVRDLREFVLVMKENWTTIKLVGEALVFAFGASKLSSMLSGLQEVFRSINSAGKAQVAMLQERRAAQQGTIAAEARAEVVAANEKAALDQASLRKKEIYYKGLLTKHANYLAKIRALEAENDILDIRYSRRGGDASTTTTYQNNAALIAATNRKIEQNDRLIQKEREIQRAMKDGIVVLEANAAKHLALAVSAEKVVANVGLVTKTMTAARWVLGAMGGWIGLITTALTVAIPMWLTWGNKGEEAIKKVHDAINNKTSSRDTVDEIDAQIAERRKSLDGLAAAANGKSLVQGGFKKTGDTAEWQNEYARMTNEILVLQDRRKIALAQAVDNEAEQKLAARQDAFTREMAQLDQQANAELSKMDDASGERMKRYKSGSKEYLAEYEKDQKARQKKMAELSEQAAQVAKRQREKAIADLTAAEKGGDPYAIAAAKAISNEANAQYIARQRMASELAHVYNDPTELTNGTGSGKGGKYKRDRDPLLEMIEKAQGDLAAAQVKMDDLADGIVTFERLKSAALQKLMGERLAGQFGDLKDPDPKNRPRAESDPMWEELAALQAKIDATNRARRAQEELNKAESASTVEYTEALDRLTNGDQEKATSGMLQLRKKLEDVRLSLVEGSDAMREFNAKSQELVARQALTDLANFGADLRNTTEDLRASINDDEVLRREEQYQKEVRRMREKFEARERELQKQAAISGTEEAQNAVKAAQEQYYNWQIARAEQHAKDMRTPLQQLGVEWQQVTNQMQSASTKWADSTIDLMVQAFTGVKVEWRSALSSMLTDMLRINLQKQFGNIITSGLQSLTDGMSSMMKGEASGGFGGMLAKAGDALKGFVGGLSGATGATQQQTDAIAQGTIKTIADIAGTTSKITAEQAATASLIALADAAAAASVSMGGSAGGMASLLGWGSSFIPAGSTGGVGGMAGVYGAGTGDAGGLFSGVGDWISNLFSFATGGVMTSKGALELRKYAKGGIANSPQLALYGEGSMSEAFVPLPDGRSIPVSFVGSMQGGVSNAVSINVVVNNNGNGKTEASEGDATGAWKQMTNRIKQVVLEEITTQKRPGGALYS